MKSFTPSIKHPSLASAGKTSPNANVKGTRLPKGGAQKKPAKMGSAKKGY